MLRGVSSEQETRRRRDAVLGMVPVVTILACFAIARGVAALLGLSDDVGAIGGCILAVFGFFVSRAILRRGFAERAEQPAARTAD